jgi:WD40 repeat protein
VFERRQEKTSSSTTMLRLETEFIPSDLQFNKYDDKGLISIASDTFETKYAGHLSTYRTNMSGTLEEVQAVGLNTGGVSLAQSSSYSAFIVTAHTDPVLRLWTLNQLQQPIKRYTFHNMSVESLDYSPFDGEEFISCSKDSSFAIWKLTESEPVFAATNDASFPVLSTQYHPQNSSLMIAAPLDSKLELWDRQELKRVYTVTPPDDLIFSCMAFNQYNEYMLSVADEYGHVYIWDLRQLKKPVCHFQAHGLSVCQMKFNPHDEKLMGTASTDSHFHLWYIATGGSSSNSSDSIEENNNDSSKMDSIQAQCLKSFKTHNLPITSWDWSVHELGLLVDGGSDYSIFMWNFVDCDENVDLSNHTSLSTS